MSTVTIRAVQAIGAAALVLLGMGIYATATRASDTPAPAAVAVVEEVTPTPTPTVEEPPAYIAADLETFVRRWNKLNVSDEWPLPFDLDVSDGAVANTATHLFDDKSALMLGFDKATGAVTDITFMASQNDGWLEDGEAAKLGDGLATFMMAAHDEKVVNTSDVRQAARELKVADDTGADFARALGGLQLLDTETTVDGVEYAVVAGGGIGAVVTAKAIEADIDPAARQADAGPDDHIAIVASLDHTEHPHADAKSRAAKLVDLGHSAGALNADDYDSLTSGYWVVYAGPFDTADEAAAWCDTPDASVIAPDCYPAQLTNEPAAPERSADEDYFINALTDTGSKRAMLRDVTEQELLDLGYQACDWIASGGSLYDFAGWSAAAATGNMGEIPNTAGGDIIRTLVDRLHDGTDLGHITGAAAAAVLVELADQTIC